MLLEIVVMGSLVALAAFAAVSTIRDRKRGLSPIGRADAETLPLTGDMGTSSSHASGVGAGTAHAGHSDGFSGGFDGGGGFHGGGFDGGGGHGGHGH